METVVDGQVHYVLDKIGNVLGGIRTPWVDVPVAKLSASGQTGAGLSFLFGTTQIFENTKLKTLYPGGADVPEIRALAFAMYPGS
jgi:hypothetical protein